MPNQFRQQMLDFLDIATSIGKGDSIQEEYDNGQNVLIINDGYDPSADNYPIRLQERDEPLIVSGYGATLGGTLKIIGKGPGGYSNPVIVRGLNMANGTLKLEACPYAVVFDITITGAGHGVEISRHIGDPDTQSDNYGSYGVSLINVMAYACGGSGFVLDRDAHPHATSFKNCHAIACQDGYRLRGASVSLHGCSSQLNHGYGYDVRGTIQTSIEANYMEGNGRSEAYPLDLYGSNVTSLVFERNYCQAAYSRSKTHDYDTVQRCVNVHDCDGVFVEKNTFTSYGDIEVKAFRSDNVVTEKNTRLGTEVV